MILLDTHVLVWLLTTPDRLSVKASELISQNYNKTPILVSSISIWEITLLVQKGTLNLFSPRDKWLKELNSKKAFQFVPIDNTIAFESQALPGTFHKDPADRFIVATAIQLGATLITKDEKMRRYKHVQTLW